MVTPGKDHMRNRILDAEASFAHDHSDHVLRATYLESCANRIISRAAFKKMISPRVCAQVVVLGGHQRRDCVPSIDVHGSEYWTIRVDEARHNATKLNVFHSMAHGIQNVTMRNGWPQGQIHDVEFVKLYLDLVRRYYNQNADPVIMKEVKRYLLDANVKTATRSPEARQAARERWTARKVPGVREQLLKMRQELREDW